MRAKDRVRDVEVWNWIEGNPVISSVVAALIVAAVLAFLKPVRIGAARLLSFLRRLRITTEPRSAPEPDAVAWVQPPHWRIVAREENPGVYGLQNFGGDATHVHLTSESADLHLAGTLDWERFPGNHTERIDIMHLSLGGLTESIMGVTYRDANGVPQSPTRVSIPGIMGM